MCIEDKESPVRSTVIFDTEYPTEDAAMESENLSKQIEEVEALRSIYSDDWKTDSEVSRSYSITVRDGTLEVYISVRLPSDYPSASPPCYELSAPWMQRKIKENLHREMNQVYLDNIGETVIFQWIEKIRETLQNINQKESTSQSCINAVETHPGVREDMDKLSIPCPEISHGEVITDRKSSFQGHAAKVHSVDEVNAVLHVLKQNKKIANAFHNMYAYRIEINDSRTRLFQDCDDDGEAHAGGRLLHLLQILDQKSAVVVVSRWYGGIQLGPDRFRHINNAARSAMKEAGLLKN